MVINTKKQRAAARKNACDSSSVYEFAVCLKFPKDLYLVRNYLRYPMFLAL